MAKAAFATDEAAKGGLASSSVYDNLKKLEKPAVRRAVVMLAFTLMLPAALSGLSQDDYVLLDELSSGDNAHYAGRAPFELFRWMEPGMVSRLIDGGGVSWWVHPQTRVAFMRPLSSLTHALDYVLWPSSAFAMHLHNLFWFALLVLFTFRTYRAFVVRPWTLGVACAMFALDSAHAGPVSWIANRNGVMSAAIAVASLLCHHHARTASEARARWGWTALAFGTFVTSLMAGELGVGILGYILAYALLYESGSWRSRLLSLTPYGLVLAIVSAVRGPLGYGVVGGFGNYIDPMQEPGRFLRILPIRGTMLIASQITRFCSDLYEMSLPPTQLYVWAVAAVLLVIGVWFVLPVLRADRVSRFLFAGAVLSAIPPVGATASERLLLLVGVGMPPVLAEAIRRILTTPLRMRYELFAARRGGARSFGPPTFRHGVAGCLILAHLGLDPMLIPLYGSVQPTLGRQTNEVIDQLGNAPKDGRTVIVASTPDCLPLYYAHVTRKLRGEPELQKLYWLSSSSEGTHFRRMGLNELRVTSPAGFWDARWEERSPELPFHVGDKVELSEMSLRVVEVTADGRPSTVDFAFREPLESSHYSWLNWQGGKLEPFVPPSQPEPEHRANLSAMRSAVDMARW